MGTESREYTNERARMRQVALNCLGIEILPSMKDYGYSEEFRKGLKRYRLRLMGVPSLGDTAGLSIEVTQLTMLGPVVSGYVHISVPEIDREQIAEELADRFIEAFEYLRDILKAGCKRKTIEEALRPTEDDEVSTERLSPKEEQRRVEITANLWEILGIRGVGRPFESSIRMVCRMHSGMAIGMLIPAGIRGLFSKLMDRKGLSPHLDAIEVRNTLLDNFRGLEKSNVWPLVYTVTGLVVWRDLSLQLLQMHDKSFPDISYSNHAFDASDIVVLVSEDHKLKIEDPVEGETLTVSLDSFLLGLLASSPAIRIGEDSGVVIPIVERRLETYPIS